MSEKTEFLKKWPNRCPGDRLVFEDEHGQPFHAWIRHDIVPGRRGQCRVNCSHFAPFPFYVRAGAISNQSFIYTEEHHDN